METWLQKGYIAIPLRVIITILWPYYNQGQTKYLQINLHAVKVKNAVQGNTHTYFNSLRAINEEKDDLYVNT